MGILRAAYRAAACPADACCPHCRAPGRAYGYRVRAEIRQSQRAAQQAAVGVRIRAHAPRAVRRQRTVTGAAATSASNSSCGRYERSQASSRRSCAGLSRTAASGTWCARQKPCDCACHPRRPGRSSPSASAVRSSASAGRRPMPLARASSWMRRISSTQASSTSPSRGAWHRVVALDKMRRPAIAAQQRLELLVRDAREHRGVVDLVAVEAAGPAVLRHRGLGLGTCCRARQVASGAGFRLAVAHHHRHQQSGLS
jgi:hypothetical protein